VLNVLVLSAQILSAQSPSAQPLSAQSLTVPLLTAKTKTMEKIKTHRELKVYQSAFKAAMTIFDLSKEFPKEEVYSLTDQIRRSSRSVCANTAEAFRRRKYPKSFSNKLNESEAEAAETQNWLDFALSCGYITREDHKELDKEYENIIGMLVSMQKYPEKWKI
jgi:four helix bundle protein